MLDRAVTWLGRHLSMTREGINVLLALALAVETAVLAVIAWRDAANPFKSALYASNVSAITGVIQNAHAACDEMAAAIRRLQREHNTDPELIEATWNHFVSAGTILLLLLSEDELQTYDSLQTNLLQIRHEFLAWKHSKARETYDEADQHATRVQVSCVGYIYDFVYRLKADEGYERMSRELHEQFKQPLEDVYRGGGDGGGGA